MLQLNKIYAGDCLELMSGIDDGSIDMILCDLPYGISACHWDIIIPFDRLWPQYKRIIKNNGAIVLTASQPFTTDLIMSNREMFKYEWIWDKGMGTNFLLAHKMPLKAHENICVFYKNLPTYNPQKNQYKHPDSLKKTHVTGYRYSEHYRKIKALPDNKDILKFPTSVIYIRNQNTSNQFKKQLDNYHATKKPVKLFKYLIETYTNPGEVVLDNCIGSGTTAIAAVMSDRKFIGMEIDPAIIEIANKRIERAFYQTSLEL